MLKNLKKSGHSFKRTAIVLGNEALLIPVLRSIPKDIGALNITMGMPLRSIPLSSLFEQLFQIHKNFRASFFYKDIIALLSHEFINPLFRTDDNNIAESVIESIQSNNLVYLTRSKLVELAQGKGEVMSLLVEPWDNDPQAAIGHCISLIYAMKAYFDNDRKRHQLALEYLFRFSEVFNTLRELLSTYEHVQQIKTLHGLYREILLNETLDFQGEPLEGISDYGNVRIAGS